MIEALPKFLRNTSDSLEPTKSTKFITSRYQAFIGRFDSLCNSLNHAYLQTDAKELANMINT
jgi:hypothetical protein